MWPPWGIPNIAILLSDKIPSIPTLNNLFDRYEES